MANLLEISKASQIRRYYTTSGGAEVLPLNNYTPPVAMSPEALLAIAFSPTGTSVAINPGADDTVVITNGTARICACYEGATTIGHYAFRASARRKPGTTGAIVAQSIIFTVNSLEIGRFAVVAADASTDPVCGFFESVYPAVDTRTDLSTYNLTCTCTAADSDLEIFFEIGGYSLL